LPARHDVSSLGNNVTFQFQLKCNVFIKKTSEISRGNNKLKWSFGGKLSIELNNSLRALCKNILIHQPQYADQNKRDREVFQIFPILAKIYGLLKRNALHRPRLLSNTGLNKGAVPRKCRELQQIQQPVANGWKMPADHLRTFLLAQSTFVNPPLDR
jgi:hypothetical protein